MDILDAYRGFLRRRGFAATTIDRRIRELEMVERATGPLLELTYDRLEDWLDSRPGRQGTGISNRTRICWISTLHCFYGWAVTHELAVRDPTARLIRPKLSRYLPRPIREDDYRHALACAPPMMFLWLLLGGHAGLRCLEVATLSPDDIDLGHRPALRVLGKGDKERIIPLHRRLVDPLQTWPRSGDLLFRNQATGEAYRPYQVSHLVGYYLRSIGVRASMHQLRHRFATVVYDETGDLAVVAELLGHANLDTTRIYAEISSMRKRRAVDGID